MSADLPARVLPFTIAIPDAVLDDLHDRLRRTRWPDEEDGIGWVQGTNLEYLRGLVDHWLHRFDWRAIEAELNRFAQYRAEVGGIGIHFVHERGRGPAPLPLILTHGWPSTFTEFSRVIPLLTNPAAHGGDPRDAFDVVVPSLPGFGFSDRPARLSPPWIDDLWAELMLDVLGYDRFGAQGGDIGAGPTSKLGRWHADRVVGIHFNSDTEWPDPEPPAEDWTDEERTYKAKADRWERDEGGYAHIQGTKPQTLAYGLTDSPAGLAAWIVEKFRAWGDTHGDVGSRFSLDELITNITIYWVTDTINAANRYYWRSRYPSGPVRPSTPVTVPTGIVSFPAEDLDPPRSWTERVYQNITRFTTMPRGGHFAAQEEPELLVDDIRAFFRPLR
jgi:pimeloyl-ACP methyl ester carboxylesterase